MPQKLFNITGIGQVSVIKRRNSKNLRISISPTGHVRISIPRWTPYITGITFARSKIDWINTQLTQNGSIILADGCLIGRHHRLVFVNVSAERPLTKTRVSKNKVVVSTNLSWDNPAVQKTASKACERALREESKRMLPQRVNSLANEHDFRYSDVKISKLSSRWGSCSNRGVITLSYFLIQLPSEMIDYVILHELVHTKHLNHGKVFWDELSQILPDARQKKKIIHSHKPRVEPQTTVAIT
jgi:predicted metal-dependent hydrolase